MYLSVGNNIQVYIPTTIIVCQCHLVYILQIKANQRNITYLTEKLEGLGIL